mmetsp:Transcript_9911/g.15877  ORF Transcript_9911/g.15877 Transcript_9911/m.15877 type:complete len:726 (+) Transcript_9911:68-2245(+)
MEGDGSSRDLLRDLQENEGYEVYEFFEAAQGRKGTRVLAHRRMWVEAIEQAMACQPDASSSSTAEVSSTSSSQQVTGEEGSGEDAADNDPWVVLMPKSPPSGAASRPHAAPVPRSRDASKGRIPPPPPGGLKAKAKGPPGRPPSAKCKGAAAPLAKAAAAPPFGKRLHWKPLPEPSIEHTIFEELRPWGEVVPQLNKEQLERLFSPAPRAPARERGPSGSLAEGSSGPSVPRVRGSGQVCLLDDKRAQNLAIALRQVNIPTDELALVLQWLRVGHQVSAETLEHVHENLVSSLLECSELVNYTGPPEALRDVERQLLPLARLSRLKARLRTLLFSKTMPSLHSSLVVRIRLLRSACEQVRNSAALRLVLEMALRVGNYLNHGLEFPSASGAALEVRGISIDSLLKLREFRGGEASALHCIVLHLCPHHPDLLRQLRKQLQALFEPSDGTESCISDGGISDLHDSAGRFQSEIDLVQGEMDRFGDCYRLEGEVGQSEGTGPLAVLQRLLEDSRELAAKMDEELQVALGMAKCLLEYFGERQPQGGWASEAYLSVEKFFATIKEFVISLEDAWREVLENPRKLRLEGLEKVVPSASSPRSNGSGGSSVDTVQPRDAVQPNKDTIGTASDASDKDLRKDTSENANTISESVSPPVSGEVDKEVPTSSCGTSVKRTTFAAEAAALFRRRKSSSVRVGGMDFGPSRLLPSWPPSIPTSTAAHPHLPLFPL